MSNVTTLGLYGMPRAAWDFTPAPPVIAYPNPLTLFLGFSAVIAPSYTGTPTGFEEVAGADDVLADFNYQINATTGVLTAIDGTGATPLGDYSVKIKATSAAGDSNTVTLIVHVIRPSSGEGGAVRSSAVRGTAVVASAIRGSAVR